MISVGTFLYVVFVSCIASAGGNLLLACDGKRDADSRVINAIFACVNATMALTAFWFARNP